MQFRDLKAQYAALKDKIDKAMLDVAASSAYIMGKEVYELEEALAHYVGTKHCISCANGTDALSLGLRAWGIKKGDAVFVPGFTFFASAEVISYAGATPVFVDVEEDTFNLDIDKLELCIKSVIEKGDLVPKAVMPVDLFGLPANYKAIHNIAQKYDLLVLEDAAQGFGGSINSKKACSFGDISTTSFFPAKPLGCYGDGGAVFTDNDEYADILKSLRFHGKGSYKYDNVRIGQNSRLDTMQAAILKVKLDAFIEYELDAVNKAAGMYTNELAGTVKTPEVADEFRSSWAQYTIVLDNNEARDGLQKHLKENEIPSMIYYPKSMNKQTAFTHLDYVSGDLSVTEMLCETVLSLPMHPYLTQENIAYVCDAVKSYL